MPSGPVFPAFLRLEHLSGDSAKASFLAEVGRITDGGKAKFREFSTEAQRQITAALSVQRNAGGSLDLGVGDLKAAAAAQGERARAAREVANATALAAKAIGDESQQARLATAAVEALAIDEERAAAAALRHAGASEQVQQQLNRQASTTRLVATATSDHVAAAQALRAALDPTLALQQRYDAELARADTLLATATISQREYAAAVQLAQNSLQQGYSGLFAQQAQAEAARLQEVARAQTELARSATELRSALDPTLALQIRFDQEMARADDLIRAGAISTREYAAAQQLARNSLQQSYDRLLGNAAGTDQLAGSTRGLRQATLQSGQQLQDVAISLYSGQQASVVFAQQLPQLAFALTALRDSADPAHAAIGRYAEFLAGPWGVAVGLAVGVAASLVFKLIEGGEEADKTAKKFRDLSEVLRDAKASYEELIEVTARYNKEQERSRETALQSAQSAAGDTDKAIRREIDKLRNLQEEELRARGRVFDSDTGGYKTGSGKNFASSELRKEIAEQIKVLESLRLTARNNVSSVAQERAKLQTDPQHEVTEKFKRERGEVAKLGLGVAETTKRFAELNRQEEAALKVLSESNKKRRERTTRDPGELTSFISPVAGGRISGQFGENRGNRRHGGIDIEVPVGTPVRAPAGGIVVEAGTLPGYGNVVYIDHGGGTISRLAHLSKIGAAQGQLVAQGDVIGLSGGARGAAGSGNSGGPHLHQEVRVSSRAVNPLTGRFPTDGLDVADRAQEALEKSAEAAAEAEKALKDFGERSAESIARVNERFNEQPRLIDQAAQATRQLDATIADLADRKPPDFQNLIAEAEAAKGAIRDALVRPFEELERDSERRIAINRLLAQGRDDEASALQEVWRLENDLGPLTAARRDEVFSIVAAERAASEELAKQRETVDAYLEATRSIRSEIEGLLSGDKPNFSRIFKQLQGKLLFEKFFGDAFRELDKSILRETGIDESVDKLIGANTRVEDSALGLADVLDRVSGRIGGSTSSGAGLGSIFDGVVDGIGGASNDNGASRAAAGIGAGIAGVAAALARARGGGSTDGEIVVTARLPRDTVAGMTPGTYGSLVGNAIMRPLAKQLDGLIPGLSGVIGGALGGFATGGAPGGVIGALKGIKGLPEAVDKLFGSANVLGKAADGAATGTAVAGFAKALGFKKFSTTGSQIGGAIGSALPIPGGEIIGSIIGGTIGGLLKKAKTGSATIGGLDGALGVTGTGGNNAKFRDAASGTADSIIGSVERIAEALGGTVDASRGSVSVGIRNGSYRLDPTGGGNTKIKKGAIDFGKDGAEAVVRAAALDLIADGVIAGLRAGTQKLLKAGKDLDAALQKALDFEGVFTRLRAIKDPVGAALDTLDKEFSRLDRIFKEAGASAAEYADLEELYGIERAKAVKEAAAQLIGSLKGLLDELTIGNEALSLRDRKAAAQSAYDPLRARVAAGDSSAYDDFAQAARALLGIERQLSGSQDGYFALLGDVTKLSQAEVDRNAALADAAAGRDSPFKRSAVASNDNQGVIDGIATSNALLEANNQNLGTIIQLLRANGGAAPDLGVLSDRGFF